GGTRASLHRLTLADARAFVAEHYRPSNVALLVTGESAVTLARVASRLPDAVTARDAGAPRSAGGNIQAAASAAPGPAAAVRPQTRPDRLNAAVALPEIWLAYDLGGGGYDSAIAKILTSRPAESAVRARLMPEKEVLDVGFHAIALPGRTILACQIQLENDRRNAAIAERARDLIWRLWSDAPPPDADGWTSDWQRNPVLDLRQAALADAIFAAEPFVDRTLERALDFQTTGAVEAYDRVLATIAAVQPADLSHRAFQLLAPERARTLFLEPLAEALRPPPGPVGVAGSDNQPLAMTRLHAAEMGAPPPVTAPASLRDAKVMTLPNGLTVVLAPRRQFPSVAAVLGFYGGAAAMPPAVLEVVRIVEGQLTHGRHPDRLEVVHADGRGFTADFVRTDRRRLSNALFSLADRIKMIAETDWALLLARAQAHLGRTRIPSLDEPRAIAAQRILAALYGNHPYGRRVGIPDLLALDTELAPLWLPRLYNPHNGFLVIVGDFDPNAAARLVSGWFGSWQAKPDAGRMAAPPVPAPNPQPAPQVIIVNRPVASQTEVAFACRLAYPTTGRERVAQDVVEGLLGSYLSSRIREQAGAAYSISSSAVSLPGGGSHLTVSMSVDTRRLRDALRVLRAEVTALGAGRIEKGAFSQVRWALARKTALEYQTSLDTAAQIVDGFTRGLPIETLTSDPGDLARVTEQDVARVFAPCASTQVLSLIGDEPTIRASM
ncbi:MAG TPA: insulinase family protein, partial [Polyangia bacterium]|nr:insulinase family protein [Polyangia bacterium]